MDGEEGGGRWVVLIDGMGWDGVGWDRIFWIPDSQFHDDLAF